jgi:hypothetical protein
LVSLFQGQQVKAQALTIAALILNAIDPEKAPSPRVKTRRIPRERNHYFLTGRGKKKAWLWTTWPATFGSGAASALSKVVHFFATPPTLKIISRARGGERRPMPVRP